MNISGWKKFSQRSRSRSPSRSRHSRRLPRSKYFHRTSSVVLFVLSLIVVAGVVADPAVSQTLAMNALNRPIARIFFSRYGDCRSFTKKETSASSQSWEAAAVFVWREVIIVWSCWRMRLNTRTSISFISLSQILFNRLMIR